MKLHLFSILVLGAIPLQACAPAATQAPATEAVGTDAPVAATEEVTPSFETVHLKVQVPPFISSSPYFIAVEEGYFVEQGLDVEFISLVRSSDTIPALLQGDLDVINGALGPSLINTVASGADFKIVADRVSLIPQGCSYAAMVVRKEFLESGAVEDPNAVIRISGSAGGAGEFLDDLIFEQNGIPLERVQLVDIPTEAVTQGLLDSGIDMALLVEPDLTRALQTGQLEIWARAEDVMANFLFGTVAFGPNLLNGDHAIGERFMVAYLKAVRQYNEGKTDRNVQILAAATQLEEDLVRSMCWPAIRSDGIIDFSTTEVFQQWAVSKGYVDAPVTEEQFWDGSFLDYANEFLGGSAP